MSSLFLFTERKWFRRLWMTAVGLLLGYGYAFGLIEDIVFVPAGLGFVVGMLSHSLLASLVNTLIMMFAYTFSMLVFVLAGNLGAGEAIVWDYYQDLLVHFFVLSTVPLFTWFPAMMLGLVVRFLLVRLLVRERLGRANS